MAWIGVGVLIFIGLAFAPLILSLIAVVIQLFAILSPAVIGAGVGFAIGVQNGVAGALGGALMGAVAPYVVLAVGSALQTAALQRSTKAETTAIKLQKSSAEIHDASPSPVETAQALARESDHLPFWAFVLWGAVPAACFSAVVAHNGRDHAIIALVSLALIVLASLKGIREAELAIAEGKPVRAKPTLYRALIVISVGTSLWAISPV